ncbi:putative late blight resistance protein homolog R1A-10 [Salvia splendens]|uniref:putative late blight resistance protein homolog R1A-10 n=1 Tax=Salvia splendens TaxID=180675 RepID=UPI001C272426|nr:putative late blight resistance protein homolog R1A-10 [Salvia splendens]
MAAYSAAISLKNTIQCIVQSSRILLVSPSPQILQPAYDAMVRLQKVLLKLDDTGYSKIRTKVNDLDERMKEVVWEFEDLLETHVYQQILPQLESSVGGERHHLSFSVDLQSLKHYVDYLLKRVTVMEEEYDVDLSNMPEEEGVPISSRIDFGRISSEMIGHTVQFEEARDLLLAENGGWLSIVGMAGVGKTTFAKKVFDSPAIKRHFGLRAWVRVGRKCEYNEILRCILAQVDPTSYNKMVTQGDDDDNEKLLGLLGKRLKDKKCLIVMDDVWEWDTRVLDKYIDDSNVRVLLTSRQRLEELEDPTSKGILCLLDDEESKKLLGAKVFGEKGFPLHLEELGKKIAEKCEGLPLMIVTVAELLSKANKSMTEVFLNREELNKSIQELWTEVAKKQHNSVFVDAYNQISEVLFPSYNYLPQYLKMFFLYLGSFPPYSDIETDSLWNRFIAEGFLEPIGKETLNDFISDCWEKLDHQYHLVLTEINPKSWFSKNEFRVHSCWQHMCRKEGSRIKFLHVLQSCGDDDIKDQRRLCAHSNMLFAFKQVYGSIKSDCASTTRSLLCFGPYHRYPMPIEDMDFKLLKVLDACKVRFYHIPLEILKLVCLKYLALSYNKELPISISNLFHLQCLIVQPHVYIKHRGVVSYMPMEIWDMQELQRITVLGRDLPTPNFDATLENLSTISGVSPKSCTREILKRISKLKKLEIIMNLKPYDDDGDDNALSGLGYISEELQKLNVLSYIVMNPEMKYKSTVPLSMFPSSLTILKLNGLGCPWKHMNDIGSRLPSLKSLELFHYAFQGPKWDIEFGCFLNLKKLVIEDTDLVRWRVQHGSLPRLHLLSIRHCYKLRKLDWKRDPSTVTTPVIELVDCNLSAVTSAMKPGFKVHCAFSWLA